MDTADPNFRAFSYPARISESPGRLPQEDLTWIVRICLVWNIHCLSCSILFNRLYYLGKSSHFLYAYAHTIMHPFYVMQLVEGLEGGVVVAERMMPLSIDVSKSNLAHTKDIVAVWKK